MKKKNVVQTMQSRSRQFSKGLKSMGGDDEAQAIEAKVDETIFVLMAKQQARTAATRTLVEGRLRALSSVSEAKEQVNAFVLLLKTVHNERYAVIAPDVATPDFDRLELGCSLPERFKADERVNLFADAVGATCVAAREKLVAVEKAAQECEELDKAFEKARVEAEKAQKAAEWHIMTTPPGSIARQLIKRPYKKKSASKEEVPDEAGDSPVTPLVAVPGPKAA